MDRQVSAKRRPTSGRQSADGQKTGGPLVASSGANWGGWGGAVAPPRFPKKFFYLFHRFNVQYMYKHVKLYYISVHELLSIGGADTELLARQRKKKFLPRQKKFCPPQEICELAPLVASASGPLMWPLAGRYRTAKLLRAGLTFDP